VNVWVYFAFSSPLKISCAADAGIAMAAITSTANAIMRFFFN
jgi:hypothetical protein